MISVSIGVCAYNEEKNIGNLLKALLTQQTDVVSIREIIIVSSGSTDKTDEIVNFYSKLDSRIRLIRQKRREGKASAVNEILKRAKCEVCVLESADTIPLPRTIERLCVPFLKDDVGMCGGHPIPINGGKSLVGRVGSVLWELHHRISLKKPKMGELVAFRNIIDEIPKDTAVDEAWIEAEIRRRGYRVLYVPDAICYNKCPETFGDYLKQRRRIHAGHLHLKDRVGYEVATMNVVTVLKELIGLVVEKPRLIPVIAIAVLLEFVGRMLGYVDYVRGRDHVVWDIAETTKDLGVSYDEKIEISP